MRTGKKDKLSVAAKDERVKATIINLILLTEEVERRGNRNKDKFIMIKYCDVNNATYSIELNVFKRKA